MTTMEPLYRNLRFHTASGDKGLNVDALTGTDLVPFRLKAAVWVPLEYAVNDIFTSFV